MMSEVRSVRFFDFEAENLGEEWNRWFQSFQIYLLASKRKDDDDEVKIALLLNQLGERAIEMYNTFDVDKELTEEQVKTKGKKYALTVKKFNEYFEAKKNVLFERYKFRKLKLHQNQSILDYITKLKTAARSCEFLEKDNEIRDKLLDELVDEKLLNKLLDVGSGLTLNEATNICKQHVVRAEQMKVMGRDQKEERLAVDSIVRPVNYNCKTCNKFKCGRCGSEHGARQCPAFMKRCAYCKKLNHFERVCMEKKWNQKKSDGVWVESGSSEESFRLDGVVVDNVDSRYEKSADREWSVRASINGRRIDFKLDTGAQVNILPKSFLYKVFNNKLPKLNKTSIKLVSYGHHRIIPCGFINLKTMVQNKSVFIKFLVIDKTEKPILGLKTCNGLGLVKKVCSGDEYSDLTDKETDRNRFKKVFDGLGPFPENLSRINLKEKARPTMQAPRRVAKHLNSKLAENLNSMEKKGVISKVNKPCEWLNPLVIKKKPNEELSIKIPGEEVIQGKFESSKENKNGENEGKQNNRYVLRDRTLLRQPSRLRLRINRGEEEPGKRKKKTNKERM